MSEAAAPTDPSQGPPIPGEAAVASWVPFGLNHWRERPYGPGLRATWASREHLGYAWRMLRDGVCPCCTVGSGRLFDPVVPGLHLCPRQVQRLPELTAPALAPIDVADTSRLRGLSDAALRRIGRLPYPFVSRRGERGFSRFSWEDAIALLGARLATAAPPRQAWLANAPRLSVESAYVFERAARLVGAEPIARLGGDESDPVASLADLAGADLILLWGVDLAEQAPAALAALADAKARGARVVVVNPDPAAGLAHTWASSRPLGAVFGARLADDHVRLRPGGASALCSAILKRLIAWEAVDDAFVAAQTQGWAPLVEALRAQSLTDLCAQAGVRLGQLDWLAALIARSRAMVSLWSPERGAPARASEALLNVHLARGAIGRPSAGLQPIPRPLAAAPLAADDLDWLYTIGDLPQPLQDLSSVQTRVHQATHLEAGMFAAPGELVVLLPAQTRYEQRGGATDLSAERRLRFSPEVDGHPIIGEARPDWEIPALLAAAARPALRSTLVYTDAQQVRDEIAASLPRYHHIADLHAVGDTAPLVPPIEPPGQPRFTPLKSQP